MTDLLPWILVALLYVLGASLFKMMTDLCETDRPEPYTMFTKFVTVGLWPAVAMYLVFTFKPNKAA